jgi:hypothetical protein
VADDPFTCPRCRRIGKALENWVCPDAGYHEQVRQRRDEAIGRFIVTLVEAHAALARRES